MVSEWRKRLDKRKRLKKRRARLASQYVQEFRKLRIAGKLTDSAMDDLARKYFGIDGDR